MKPLSPSNTLTILLSQKKGYRNDDYSGYHTFVLDDVLYGEISCLMNDDIVHFCNRNYAANFDLGQDQFESNMTPEEKREIMNNFFDQNAPEYVVDVANFLHRHFGTRQLYAMWLTTVEGVVSRYGGSSNNIRAYRIPDDALVISDLDVDGSLFVTTIDPRTL